MIGGSIGLLPIPTRITGTIVGSTSRWGLLEEATLHDYWHREQTHGEKESANNNVNKVEETRDATQDGMAGRPRRNHRPEVKKERQDDVTTKVFVAHRIVDKKTTQPLVRLDVKHSTCFLPNDSKPEPQGHLFRWLQYCCEGVRNSFHFLIL